MRPIELPKGKAVKVDWVDSATQMGWNYNAEGFIPEDVESIAFVVEANRRCLTLSTSMSRRGGIVSALMIPWEAVKKITLLAEPWTKKIGIRQKSLNLQP